MIKRVTIIYFTGTGSTEKIACSIKEHFEQSGISVQCDKLHAQVPLTKEPDGFLIVLFPVHACRAPKPVEDHIASFSSVKNGHGAVLSVSGGGEISPNTASRNKVKSLLRRKGYAIDYEDMFIMPSNWAYPTPPQVSKWLLNTYEKKCGQTVNRILAGENRQLKTRWIDHLLAGFGRLEHVGASRFAARFRVASSCNLCGWCEANCPVGNISMAFEKLQFGNHCIMCMNCLYGCPRKAIKPSSMKWCVLKEGYSLDYPLESFDEKAYREVEPLLKGYLLSGVKTYLKQLI
ncbi:MULTISPECIES: EFR1 family ferrodoxin [unclassified Fusibacter]|uniref:EFR1 family ferrodoxin n=1 Tax=unclassified Fusibacter TaxID=2624464 RepID=UPI001011545A|nr:MULTISPECIES: EFR1 family ferrodoxin [unclassified Fusibacter]MCK8059149.1 EFR1 family ferrodoxin [Fusibacter sp. A2]NPE22558.1 hypothetical protein [Fusibacter sp. A1]RXV60661.1 hypothetical protein DWB64_11975 [Fusibacter sp. A1]